jgi:uncharacterized CHY-type Zn-finger protein
MTRSPALVAAFLGAALLLAAPPSAATSPAAPAEGLPANRSEIAVSDRLLDLEEYHGYYPCSDCHAEQETNPTPRFLEDEHAEPLEWEDETGETRVVEFGELLAVRDLLEGNGIPGLRGRNLVRIGRQLDLETWMEHSGASPEDSVWVLTHGGANLWCLDCHDTEDRDHLRRMNGELLTFNESHLLCGQCHGPILTDWEQGVHGRTNGYWNLAMDEDGESRRLVCVECHVPHAPQFRGMSPEPAPVARLDNISRPDPHALAHPPEKGTGDDLGPHPWEKEAREEEAAETAAETDGGAHP